MMTLEGVMKFELSEGNAKLTDGGNDRRVVKYQNNKILGVPFALVIENGSSSILCWVRS